MPVFRMLIAFLLALVIGQSTKAYVGNTQIWIKIAKTTSEHRQGLSGVKTMADNQGMLFVFDQKDKYSFWMKDMNFNLDFIWISERKVVDLTENVPSPNANRGEIAQIYPKIPVDMVLEVRSGFINKNKIKIGDRLKYQIQ